MSQHVQEEDLSKSGRIDGATGGSVLGVLEEVIRVGQVMGYSMEGCEKDIESIIGNQGAEGYSQNSKAYIVFNKHTKKVKESLNVTFDETPPPSKTSPLVDDDLDEEEAIKVIEKKDIKNNIVDETLDIDEIVNIKESRNHSLENVIENLNQRTLRSLAQNKSNFFCFISTIEPKNVNEALDASWIVAMQEELNQLVANEIWKLVPQPKNMTIIGTKWVFRNKLEKNGIVSRNKARLVAQGSKQQEGIDYDETYALVARLESIIILLAYACVLDFKLFQMDVKSAFLNGFINEEETDIETVVYADSDHARDYVDRKSTNGIYTFVGCCLTSWFLKKQTALAISTTEAEYVSARKACPYQTNLPSPDYIISFIREDREGQVTRIRHQEEFEVKDYQILTREIVSTLKPLEEIIRENVFCLGGNRDHVPACLCYMLYCVANSKKFNLAYFMTKRMEWVTKQAKLILPYGMLLTCLFDFIIDENPKLTNKSYVLYDRVMNPLAAQLERKPRKDRGTRRGLHSTSSSTFNEPSSSHLNNDDDGNNEGTSCASTPSPIRYVYSLTNKVS
nr:retrovirus-related Pol polyprotein from transposon TNT 1-94 [Tanacetum cinerariifolium]